MLQVAAVSLNVPLPIKCMKSFEPKRSAMMPRTLAAPRAVAATASETFAIDYNSPISVFPMEACDLLGGDACAARMFPETKLAATTSTDNNRSRTNSQEIDRDYLAYDEPKTVFPGEACDNLGGEFCEAIYQQGVQQDLVLA